MRKIITVLFLFALSVNLSAQRFEPYHAYGIQINLNRNGLYTTTEGDIQIFPGQELSETSNRIDIYGHYDYGMFRWLGIGTGVGLSMRGGSHSGIALMGPQVPIEGKRNIYYLNVPVRLQFKPWHFFWIEPGMEFLYYIGYNDQGKFTNPYNVEGPFDAEKINDFTMNLTFAFRFNIYKGLSINVGLHSGLTEVAAVQAPSPPYSYAETSYQDYGYFLGLRYMFNQAAKARN